jgi:hypothetical protein
VVKRIIERAGKLDVGDTGRKVIEIVNWFDQEN